MQHIKVIFGTNNLPLSCAIRWFTHSHWSHVAVVLDDRGDGQVIESVFGDGVRKTTYSDFVAKYPRHKMAYFPVQDASRAKILLEMQLGKPYDVTAILSLLFRRQWDKPSRWFCSELVAFASCMFRFRSVRRVTPEDIWKLSRDSAPPNY
ncbi:hypothetical protein HMF8227_02352 [Saliniradius amylolyticus]|uniref:Permuted papain-like amidase YaeF/Yiix C92 family enzyme n=1 Tax=Saliniradius amylolyticus TaxID=2183582 RepID=A0A2S2E572_9ALTE|nr:YiiX/YebB-like N1pC/P60 family cysteine hydrolase [Saliniradius amylolyticus]AWL12804.1 hypothetical protein HMF8227_02352 [Saliniradius amylolyticus]